MCVVQLARLCKLACLRDRGIEAPQVRQGGSERQSVEDLGNTGLLHVALSVFSPVTRSERCLEPVGDDVWLEGLLKQDLVVAIIDVLLQDFGHDVGEGPEELPEVCSKQ